MKKKILFIIPRGEVIRNFAYSGIISQLRKFYNVHLLTVIPNADLKIYLQEMSDGLDELKFHKPTYFHGYLLNLLDLAHNRYLWSEAARVRWNMRDAEANSFFSKVKRTLNKLLAIIMATNRSLRWFEFFILKLSKYESSVQSYIKRINEIQPDLVFNGSHSHASIAYHTMQAARILGIKTASFLFSWDNLTSQGRVIPPSDYYLAWNKQIQADFLRIYPHVSQDRVFVSGTPQFIFHFNEEIFLSREIFLQLLSLKPDDKYILYSAGMSHHMPHEPYVVERIADLIKGIGSEYKLVVRTYAKDKFNVFEDLRKRRTDIIMPEVYWEKNFQTPLIKDQLFFSNLLKHCTAGINIASTISLELCMFDKPAINVGYNPPGLDIYPYNYTRFYNFDHYRPIVESGAIEVAKSEEELLVLLKSAIEDPMRLSKYRNKLVESFFEGNLGDVVISKMLTSFNEILN